MTRERSRRLRASVPELKRRLEREMGLDAREQLRFAFAERLKPCGYHIGPGQNCTKPLGHQGQHR